MGFKVRRFDTDQAIRLAELIGSSAKGTYAKELPKQGQSDDGLECGEADPADDQGWRIAHHKGRSHPYFHQTLGSFGCAVDAMLSMALPRSLTGDPSSAPAGRGCGRNCQAWPMSMFPLCVVC